MKQVWEKGAEAILEFMKRKDMSKESNAQFAEEFHRLGLTNIQTFRAVQEAEKINPDAHWVGRILEA